MHDLVIRNGTIIDGSGGAAFVGDVAIDGEVIAAVGQDVGPGKREIDATGLTVTPGWVDMHTHYDGQVTWDPYFTPSGWHGVTTVVMGNCGVGFAPVRKDDREWIINVMEGVEDIPGSALSEGIKWGWESFPEYLDFLESLPHAIDYATQIPHSALRGYVMGRRASEEVDATPEEIAQMKAIVAEALEAGALGFSTSRTPLHKTAEGVLVAGTNAEEEELFGIAQALKETGKGVFEIAHEHEGMERGVRWLRNLAQSTGRPVVFNLSQTDHAPGLWKQILGELEQAAKDKVPLYGQVAGRAIGILMSWQTTAHPFALHPSWHELSLLSWEQKLERLKDPAWRQKMVTEKAVPMGEFETFVTQSFDKMYIMKEGDEYEPRPEESVAALAKAQGLSPQEVAYDALMRDNGTGFVYFPLFNYTHGSLDVLHELHTHPQTFMGLADGGAHCGAICDAGMPTFMITHWTRDRDRGERLGLEYMVRRQTRETAELYGMTDRGLLKPGMKADINVFDYKGLRVNAPELVHDLPAGGRRLVQRPEGYKYTLCSGQIIFENGQATGAMPGKLVRG